MIPVVSVIVPVYNSIDYVDRIIDDLHEQTFEQSEFILLDDGSTDGTTTYLKKKVSSINDDRFVVYNKENTGVSDTRNLGLSMAKGQYIIFVDADDDVPKNFVESYYTAITNNGTDIEFFPFNRTSENNVGTPTGIQIDYSTISSSNILNSHQMLELTFSFKLPGYPFGYISKKSIWNNNSFPIDIHFTEDFFALVNVLSANDLKGHINNTKYYNYVQRTSSIMHNAGENEEVTSDIVIERLINILALRNVNDRLIKIANNFLLAHYLSHCENALIRKNLNLFRSYKLKLWKTYFKSKMSWKSRISKTLRIAMLFFPQRQLLRLFLIRKREVTKQEPIK